MTIAQLEPGEKIYFKQQYCEYKILSLHMNYVLIKRYLNFIHLLGNRKIIMYIFLK